MNEKPDLKLTDFDYLTGDHHLQMMKAALPYVNISEQKFLSILVKFRELQNTISLFEEEEVATMGICSLEPTQSNSPLDMLDAIKPYGNVQEQDFIDMVSNFVKGYRLGSQYQEMKSQSTTIPNSDPQNSQRKPPIEQLKSFLPPEQQSKLDTISMLMQVMNFQERGASHA